MKIGIMTFHWATNHGALLQAYALQNTLITLFPKAIVEIIDYWPEKYRKTIIKAFKSKSIKVIQRNLKDLKKERLLKTFRMKLPKSHRYYSTQQLMKEDMNYDVIIAGSDQIWNQSYTMNGEGCKTAAYYLPFCDSAVHISYAASFGSMVLDEEIKTFISPFLKKFDAISVREDSGKEILDKINIKSTIVCDPSILLPTSVYYKLAKHGRKKGFIATYLLHLKNKKINQDIHQVFHGQIIEDIEMNTEEEWIGAISDASFLVTNSYHGVIVALKMHTPFAVVLSTGVLAGMNDRFYTILLKLGLMSQVITKSNTLSKIYNNSIEWLKIDNILDNFSTESKVYLLNHCLFK